MTRSFVNNRIIVKFFPEKIDAIEVRPGKTKSQTVLEALGVPKGAKLEETHLSRLLRKTSRAKGTPVQDGMDFSRWMHLILPDGASAETHAAALSTSTLVEYAEPDCDDKTHRQPESKGIMPSDPEFKRQYYHHLIQTPQAWEITTGSPRVVVAVLDTGCALDQPEFYGRVVSGYDFEDNDPNASDADGHGTGVAGILGANAQNGFMGAGIDWRCKIMPVRIMKGGVSIWAQGIEWAVRNHADVIVISGKLNMKAPSKTLDRAISAAVAHGVAVVVSAGNGNRNKLSYPAAHPETISVGATDGRGNRWVDKAKNRGSNYGPGLDLVAPGSAILSVSPRERPVFGSGTSAAAPMVAGACSLMLSVNPALKPHELRDILRKTAFKTGKADAWRDGVSSEFGYGRLNVYRAVLKVYGAPVIFTAPKVIELPLGAPSPELLKGVTADDFVDGDLTASVLASGAVDTRKPGEYTVSYSVTDSHGNRAMPVRRVYRVFPAGASDANGNVSPEVLAPFF